MTTWTSAAAALPQRRFDSGYSERVTLADATRALVRPIRPADAPLVQGAMRALSTRTRYYRFHSPRGEFSPDELRFLTEVDGESHFALIALARPPCRLAGVGRFIRGSADPGEAEIALVVSDDLQGKGLGELLLRRLREAALERDITRFTGEMLDENRAMRGLLHKLGGRARIASRGVCEIELPLTG